MSAGPDTTLTDFAAYGDRYDEAVNEALFGADVDDFAQMKADRLVDLVRRRVGDPAAATLLDVGCGVGNTDVHLTGRVGGVIGVDLFPEVIERARAANPTAEYLVYDGRRLPFDDGAVDVAFAICVVHHVPPAGWEAFTREMARVVRPGGLAVVFEHNPLNPLTRRVVSRCEFDADAVLLGRRRTASLLRASGLAVAERAYMTFLPTPSAAAMRLERALGWLPLGAQYYVAGRREG